MNFIDITNLQEFCEYFNVTKKFLDYHLRLNKNKRYAEIKIIKKTGGFRIIHAPKKEYKYLLIKIKEAIENMYEVKENVIGFVRNKSIVDGANHHVNKTVVVNVDLENYFHTIHFGRVRGMFLSKPFLFNIKIATLLADIVTFKGILPMGSPCSPIISNIVTYSLDMNLINYCEKYNITYTRYADDLTFSTNRLTDMPRGFIVDNNGVFSLGKTIRKIIEKEDFKINDEKISISMKHNRQQVTNLTVNEKTNVSRRYIKNLRATLYNCSKQIQTFEYEELEKMRNHLKGKLNFLKMVRGTNDDVFLKYAKQYNMIFNTNEFDVDLHLPLHKYIENRIVVIETSDSTATGFIVKEREKYYLVTATHTFLDSSTKNKKTDFFYYFYHKSPKDKKTIYIDKILFKNIEDDIIVFELKDISAIKNIGDLKYFNLIEKFEVDTEEELIVAGYPLYDENTEVHRQEKTHYTSTARVFEKANSYELKGAVVELGMSGGPIINKNKKVVGVVYSVFKETEYSYFRKIDVNTLKTIIEKPNTKKIDN